MCHVLKTTHCFLFSIDYFKLRAGYLCAIKFSRRSIMNLCTDAPLFCLFPSFLPLASVPLSVAQVLHPETAQESALSSFHMPFPLQKTW